MNALRAHCGASREAARRSGYYLGACLAQASRLADWALEKNDSGAGKLFAKTEAAFPSYYGEQKDLICMWSLGREQIARMINE